MYKDVMNVEVVCCVCSCATNLRSGHYRCFFVWIVRPILRIHINMIDSCRLGTGICAPIVSKYYGGGGAGGAGGGDEDEEEAHDEL